MNVLYGLYQADEGEMLLDDAGAALRRPRRRDGGRHRHGAPALHAHPRLHRRRERHARPRGDRSSAAGSTCRRRTREGARDLRAVRLRRRPRRPRRRPPRRRAAARRDHQGALARREGARLRRADRGAHAAGDRRAHGDHAPAASRPAPRSSSSPTSCARCARSPTASPSSGSARSSARHRPTATNAELASLMVGRAVELTVHKEEPTLGDAALVVAGPHGHRPASASSSSTT